MIFSVMSKLNFSFGSSADFCVAFRFMFSFSVSLGSISSVNFSFFFQLNSILDLIVVPAPDAASVAVPTRIMNAEKNITSVAILAQVLRDFLGEHGSRACGGAA